MEKFLIETLPVTEAFLKEKRLIQERGEIALVVDGKPFKHLTYFSLKKGNGLYRGGHYHKKKEEHFYVISGTLRIVLVDLDTQETMEVQIQKGQRGTILPHCAHRFEAIEDAQVIEFYNTAYDSKDDIAYDRF